MSAHPSCLHGNAADGRSVPVLSIVLAGCARTLGRFGGSGGGRSNRSYVMIHLWSAAFRDLPAAREIERKTFRWSPTDSEGGEYAGVLIRRIGRSKIAYRQPSTNYAGRTISSFLEFCVVLGVDAGSDRTVSQVNWGGTWFNGGVLAIRDGHVCEIAFQDGSIFDSIGGRVFAYVADGLVLWALFYGAPRGCAPYGFDHTSERTLIAGVEDRLTNRLGIRRMRLRL